MDAHCCLADIFVMSSEKEVFGIVFIEAMFYGLPVIAGNKDGSVDALVNGEMGVLVNPGNILEITEAIKKVLNNRKVYQPHHDKLIEHFGYTKYKGRFEEVLRKLGVPTIN